MKRIFCLFLCITLAYLIGVSSVAAVASEEKPILSQLSENECIAFLKENGVCFPSIYEDESQWGPFVKQIITKIEENPDAPIIISHSAKHALVEEIRAVVNMYYGVTGERTLLQLFNTTPDSETSKLQHSAYYVSWDESF